MRSLIFGIRFIVLMAVGCRGGVTDLPPVHLNPNMDQQWRFDLQEPNAFFKDGRAERMPPAGTVVSGSLEATDEDHLHLHEGIQGGLYTDVYPAAVVAKYAMKGEPAVRDDQQLMGGLLARGEDRWAIYCTPCHSATGLGEGIVIQRGNYPKPQPFTEDRLRAYPLGRIVNVLKHGKANMPSYADQIPVLDRWALATYLRALQVSQAAPADLVAQNGGK